MNGCRKRRTLLWIALFNSHLAVDHVSLLRRMGGREGGGGGNHIIHA